MIGPTDLAAALEAERLRCCKAVCEFCRQGTPYNRESKGHGARLRRDCGAQGIHELPPVSGAAVPEK